MKKRKRGFTIVELVIVIAVIAILAAVLIPTFTNLIKRANLSNDQSMIRNMNTVLAMESAESDLTYAGDAINALNKNGFTGKYTPYSSGYRYGYQLETNKMYLIDEQNQAVYPDANAAVEELWFLWSNHAVDKVTGGTKYIATVNIDGQGYFTAHFGEGTYTIDLAGHYIACSETLSGVTVINGVFISGAATGEGMTEMEKMDPSEIPAAGTAENPAVVENKVFDLAENSKALGQANVTYKNCYFYNACGDGGGYMRNRTFDGCTFVDATTYIFNMGSGGTYSGTLTVKNCTFINCKRVFNIVIGVYGQTEEGTINIVGNTFYGVTEQDRGVMQFNTQEKEKGMRPTADIKYMKINISENNFAEMGSTQAGIIVLHGSTVITVEDELKADFITFSNNTVAAEIPADKYVVNDDGKADGEFNPYLAVQLKKDLTEKFTAGIKA